MNWKAAVRDALSVKGASADEDVVEELAAHAQSIYESAIARGCDHEEADRQVRAMLDGWQQQGPLLQRPSRIRPMVEAPVLSSRGVAGVLQDLEYAARVLRRQPTYAATAILTIALGIAATTTLFSIAYGVLLKPLPWPEADRLIRLTETRQGSTRKLPWIMTNATYLTWRDNPSTIENLAAWQQRTLTLTTPDDNERVRVAEVTASLFPLLRANPSLGRVFDSEDESAARGNVIVISYAMWQQRFGGLQDVLGRSLQFDGKPYTVIGVMPRDFSFPDKETRAWRPFNIRPAINTASVRSFSTFDAMARLRPGVTPAQAAAEATARGRDNPDAGLAVTMFGSNGPVEVTAVPLLEATTGSVNRSLIVLLAAGGLLLLAAAANVANLQLARATTRYREMAIRAAIGAGPSRLRQQVLLESMLLGLAGGITGLVFTVAVHSTFLRLMPDDFPRLADVALNLHVVAFAVGISCLAGAMFGILPAFDLGRIKLVEAFNQDSARPISGGLRRNRSRALIMATQVAVACTLLVGASLLARTFMGLMEADRGYDPANVLTARLNMPDWAFTPVQRTAFLQQTLARFQAVPGVSQAAFTDLLPLVARNSTVSFPMRSRQPPVGVEISVSAVQRVVSERLFSALGMRLLEGRGFTENDSAAAPLVAIVNRTFAKRYLSAKPTGEMLPIFRPTEVIGVVEDIVQQNVTDAVQPEIYFALRQVAQGLRSSEPTIVLRTASDPNGYVPTLKRILREEDAKVVVDSIMTMEDRIATNLARPRLYAMLLGTFAVFALAITGVGLFGVLSYSVAQRMREIAVRTAIGAKPSDIVRMLLKQALTVTVVGLSGGALVSLAAGRYLSTFLYGISAYDPLAFALAATLVMVVTIVACVAPAHRAVRIDPMRTLRG